MYCIVHVTILVIARVIILVIVRVTILVLFSFLLLFLFMHIDWIIAYWFRLSLVPLILSCSRLIVIVPWFYTGILLFTLLSELALTDYFNPLLEEYIVGSEDDLLEGVAEQDF